MYQRKHLLGQDFSKRPFAKSETQSKLNIGRPNSKSEQLADAVADRIMVMRKSEIIQMQSEEEEEELQMLPENNY